MKIALKRGRKKRVIKLYVNIGRFTFMTILLAYQDHFCSFSPVEIRSSIYR